MRGKTPAPHDDHVASLEGRPRRRRPRRRPETPAPRVVEPVELVGPRGRVVPPPFVVAGLARLLLLPFRVAVLRSPRARDVDDRQRDEHAVPAASEAHRPRRGRAAAATPRLHPRGGVRGAASPAREIVTPSGGRSRLPSSGARTRRRPRLLTRGAMRRRPSSRGAGCRPSLGAAPRTRRRRAPRLAVLDR